VIRVYDDAANLIRNARARGTISKSGDCETKSRHAVKRDGSLQVAAVGEAPAKGLFKLESSAVAESVSAAESGEAGELDGALLLVSELA